MRQNQNLRMNKKNTLSQLQFFVKQILPFGLVLRPAEIIIFLSFHKNWIL